MSKLATKVLVGLGGTGAALLASVTPAFAAGTFVSPNSSPFTPAVNAAGNPQLLNVQTTNFPQENVFLEVCDGKSPTSPGWDPGLDCDNGSAPAPITSTGTSYQENFTQANGKRAVPLFRGESPSDAFNCLAPQDTSPGTDPAGGNVKPNGMTTASGQPIDPAVPSWNNCQLRVSSNNASVTSDQSFLTISLPNTPTTAPGTTVPEVPLAIILPLGAAGVFAAGFAINRRRRSNAA